MTAAPAHWSMAPFSKVADYATGRTPARANPAYWQKDDNAVPWVAISDMEAHGSVLSTAENISGLAFDRIFRGRVSKAGTLLMSFKLTVGRVATLGIDACHNEAIISIYPKADIDQRFLAYYLSQVDYSEHQDRQVKGNTLNQAKIDAIPIAKPPLAEQRKIANSLDLIRLGIDTERAAEHAAKELKQSAMVSLFTRGQRGETQKETEIGWVPESWDVVQLGSLGRIGNGTTPNRRNPAYWQDGTLPWITSGRMYERQIVGADSCVTQTALKECSLPLLQSGAVLIAIVGQGKTLGHCAILEAEATVSRHVGFIQPREEIVSPRYLRGYLESQYEYLRQLASGNGSTRAALTCAILRTLRVPVPSMPEQEEIVSILDTIDRKIALHQQKRDVLEELFKALLHKLMTGEIDINDLNLQALQTTEEGGPA